jgi:DNA-binding transcriptional MerR regulator
MKHTTCRQLKIGELATVLGLNPKTIRYYEDIRLLPKPQRTVSGYRLYEAADVERLSFIGKAKAIGLTLEEIREILDARRDGQRPCQHVLALLDHKLAAVDQQLRALTEFREELVTLRKEAAETMEEDATVCSIIEQHEPAQPETECGLAMIGGVIHHTAKR